MFFFQAHFDTCHNKCDDKLPYLQSRTLVTGLLTELAEDQPLG
jgi:hypothetical protein